jgi:hypothetical protein
VAPFIEADELCRLATATPGAVRTLVSTEEAISVEAKQLGWTGNFALHYLPPGSQDALYDENDGSDDEEPEMGGLHAKFLWFQHRGGATVYLGSPNLTDRGWRRSAEAFVTLDIAKRGTSAAADSVYQGMERFLAICARVDMTALPQPTDNRIEALLEQQRKTIAATLEATQRLKADQAVTVSAVIRPVLADGVSLSIARIGDIPVAWPASFAPVALPAAAPHENSDFLHLTLSVCGQEVSWLHHAPFDPPLSDEERDLPLLQSFLGLSGLLDWLAEVLAGAGEGSGKGRDWDDDGTRKRCTAHTEALPFSIEAVLSAWVRDTESLKEVRTVMAMAKGYTGTYGDDLEARERLRAFLTSWAVLEAQLR